MDASATTVVTPGGPNEGPPPRRKRRWRRVLPPLTGLLLLVLVLGGVKAAQIHRVIAFGRAAKAAGPPPESVSTFTAGDQTWEQTLSSVGSVAAARGVSISNDTAGIVWRIDFESGAAVKQGQVLVELDTRVERAQLASAKARQELASTNLARTRTLVTSGAVAPSQLDTDKAQYDGAVADANALAAQIERKTVRAPFAGKLGIRLVNVGQFLPPGTPITYLESSEATYVDFDLPQEDLSLVGVGMAVHLTLDRKSGDEGDAGGAGKASVGAVFAIDPQVDPSTRNIRVRASVPPRDAWLRPGMYVDVAVVLPQTKQVVAIPATAIVHASYGDSVFVVEDGKARQQFVRLGPSRGDFVAVDDGVHAGQVVVSEGAFKLRNGMRVAVHDEVAPHPEIAPHPVNR